MENEGSGTLVDQDVCSYLHEILGHRGCLTTRWAIGHQRMKG